MLGGGDEEEEEGFTGQHHHPHLDSNKILQRSENRGKGGFAYKLRIGKAPSPNSKLRLLELRRKLEADRDAVRGLITKIDARKNELGTGNRVFGTCSALLEKLMRHKHAWVFNKPVDAFAHGLHDYFEVVKQPMDLGTVKNRLAQLWYRSPVEFAEDVRLTFRNATTYNPKDHDVHVMADQLLKLFEGEWATVEADCMRGLRLAKKLRARCPDKREMTYDEKQKLSVNLQSLPCEKLEEVVRIIKKRNSSVSQQDDEIEVDIDCVDTKTLWELHRFIAKYKKSLSKNERKDESIIGTDEDRVVSTPVQVEETRPHDSKQGASQSNSSSDSGFSSSSDDGSGSGAINSPNN